MHMERSGDDVVCEKYVSSKKRAATDTDLGNTDVISGCDFRAVNGNSISVVQIDNVIDEPTIGERLDRSVPKTPPSADSVHILLKQALHADDRSLLLDCLFRQDQKVITNSVSLLNPSNAFKLLESLISVIQSRGALLSCALPWLKSLLLQHSSSIICQESSLVALNSLYQLIESRISTCNPAQLSSSLDLLYNKVIDEEREGSSEAIIYEDLSDEDEDEDVEAMESNNEELEPVSDVSDLEMNEF
ncbi:uncharacterized protein [Rutidosis leptorrhynchoides]|uniref:uncharacterized protein n=1 Tax=Rutidosis leptorrhynchoides TaxID=125765 RepID=UPI003A9920D6